MLLYNIVCIILLCNIVICLVYNNFMSLFLMQQLASDTLSWSERMKDLQQKLLAQTSEFETIKKQFSKMDVEKNG